MNGQACDDGAGGVSAEKADRDKTAPNIADQTESSAPSFRQARRARRKYRAVAADKISRDGTGGGRSPAIPSPPHRRERGSVGPTAETAAKLTPDPLVIFRKRNILSDAQIWAFQRIRRAIQLITDGAQVRVSRFSDVIVQSSRFGDNAEADDQIRIQDHYHRWIDRMTAAGMAVGPVLDIILEEMSLAAVDRKRGRRKGWAKGHLQAALDLYDPLARPRNRHG